MSGGPAGGGGGFQVYAAIREPRLPPARVAEEARRAEALGFDGVSVPEAVHDGLLCAFAALGATRRIRVATSVLVAFARSPMVVALAAWDLQAGSAGRFELGLGTQVRANLVGRYGASWAAPAPRMREYVRALRAIWDAFQSGAPLDFRGEHYALGRLQPFFRPDPIAHPHIPVWVGAVGPLMNRVAGEVADGVVAHPTHASPRYLREVARPAIAEGARRAGRDERDVELLAGGFAITGRDETALRREREEVRRLLAFLFSTPAYERTLALFDRSELGPRLRALARAGRWDAMAGALDGALLDALAPSAPYGEIAGLLRQWYGGLATRVQLRMPEDPADDAAFAEVVASLRT